MFGIYVYEIGTPLGTVQAFLGNSSSEIIREAYLQSIPAVAKAAVQKVEDLLIRPKLTQVVEDLGKRKFANSMSSLGLIGRP